MDSKYDTCQAHQMHPEKIERTKSFMGPDEDFQELAETFKLLSDYNRLRILQALNIEELCVCDISALLDMSQSAASHQLRLLRAARLVRFRREGKNVYYSLDDSHVKTLLDVAMSHVRGKCENEIP
jgi:DNA-binding transcriptional ArsR family regulator